MRHEITKVRTLTLGRVLLALTVIGSTTVLALSSLIPTLTNWLIELQRANPGLHLTDADSGRFDGLLDLLNLADPAYQLSLVDIVNSGPLGGSGAPSFAILCALLIGAFIATSDFQHAGIVPSALIRPKRMQLVADKAKATLTIMTVISVILTVLSMIVLFASIALTSGASLRISFFEMLPVWGRGIITLNALGLMGLGLGLLLRSQILTLIVIFALSMVEPIATAVLRMVNGEFPTYAAALPITASTLTPRGTTIGAAMELGGSAIPLVALTAVLAWAAIALTAGTWRTTKRDLI